MKIKNGQLKDSENFNIVLFTRANFKFDIEKETVNTKKNYNTIYFSHILQEIHN